MAWSENDLKKLQEKGLKIHDNHIKKECITVPKVKIEKVSVEKNTMELILQQLKQAKLIESYEKEFQFDLVRKFRFDYCIQSKMIGIEYEGIMSEKSRHTTIAGYSRDIEKYNLAVTLGWKVLRYTAINYLELYKDLEKLLKLKPQQK